MMKNIEVNHHDGKKLEVSISLLAVVDVWLATHWTHHVADIALSDHHLKVMLKTVTADTALAAWRV